MIITDLDAVDRTDFEQRTGWTFKPEGACKGELCVPLAAEVGDVVDVETVAAALQMPLVRDAERNVWALGPEAMSGRALSTAVAPNLTLPTVDGDTFELDSLRGRKVVLVAWSPY